MDRFDDAGISWTSFQEDYPEGRGCVRDVEVKSYWDWKFYTRKHNPFVRPLCDANTTQLVFSYLSQNETKCVEHVKSAHEFDRMINDKETLPQYVFYTPNMWNNGIHPPVSLAHPRNRT